MSGNVWDQWDHSGMIGFAANWLINVWQTFFM